MAFRENMDGYLGLDMFALTVEGSEEVYNI